MHGVNEAESWSVAEQALSRASLHELHSLLAPSKIISPLRT